MRAKWLQNGLAAVVGCVLAGPSPAEASTVTVVSGGECDTAVYDCNGFPTPLPVVTYEALRG